jgi:hypothetical protein
MGTQNHRIIIQEHMVKSKNEGRDVGIIAWKVKTNDMAGRY